MCRVIAWVALASILACGVSSAPEDASAEADARLGCGSHVECDDEVFCNGVERCEMGEDGVGRCQVGVPPCAAGTSCDERRARCELGCDTDADGDGYVAVACGGDDCDDDDPAIHPGATEVCDPDHVDEDCDPTTVGDRDADGDGWIDAACCNWHLGLLRCGEDCDDTAANVNPAAPEVCDGVAQVDGPQSWGDIRLLTTDELEAALAASPVPVDRRLGIVVADVLEAAVDLAAPIFGTFRAPEIPSSPPYAVALPDGRTRIVFVNVRPGVARVRANRVGDARRAVYCAEQAGGPNDAPTYYDAVVTVDAIVHVRFGVCGVLLVGG